MTSPLPCRAAAQEPPLSSKNLQVQLTELSLLAGVWFRGESRGCSSFTDRIYSTPSQKRSSVPFVLFLIFVRGKDLKNNISAQPNSPLTFQFWVQRWTGCRGVNCYNNIKNAAELIILNLISPSEILSDSLCWFPFWHGLSISREQLYNTNNND